MKKPVERTLVIGFGVILIILLGNIVLSYRATRVIIETARLSTRRIVEMHGGTIRADSPGHNQGAIFTVMIPLRGIRSLEASADAGAGRVHPSAVYDMRFENLFSLDGLRILAVDDQPDTLEMVKAVLMQMRGRSANGYIGGRGARSFASLAA